MCDITVEQKKYLKHKLGTEDKVAVKNAVDNVERYLKAIFRQSRRKIEAKVQGQKNQSI